MRKSILSTLIGSAFVMAGSAHAGLTFDLNGSAAGGVITADAFDWAQTSFLAQGGNTAIAAFANSGGAACTANPSVCTFNVLTHAKLTGYTPTGGGSSTSLPSGFGEITMVASYQEIVTGFTQTNIGTGLPAATFRSNGIGTLEFYYSAAADATDLTGSGFNNGTLIGLLTGVSIGANGSFSITNTNPSALDGFGANDYPGQTTVSGTGSQDVLSAGLTSKTLDPTFFLTSIGAFTIQYNNISIGLPYNTVNPSDCFNDVLGVRTVGTTGNASTCNTAHVTGPYSAQPSGDPGYQPNVGPQNGFGFANPDFVAQTDFNAAVTGGILPEPGSLALVGLALGSLGFAANRRRRG